MPRCVRITVCSPARWGDRVFERNGDVESGNGHLKRRRHQYWLLRGSREFATEADYDGFLARVLQRANDPRAAKLV